MDLMNRVCKPYLDKFLIVFIDDIFIYLRRNEEYEEHLRQLSELFKNKELYTEFSKCEFWLPKVQFLCYVVDNQGIHERDLRKYSYRIYHKATKNNKQLRHDLDNRDHPKSYADVRRKPLELHAEEPIKIMDYVITHLKQRCISIIKVRWNSRRGPEFTWEREDQMQKKYLHLFANPEPSLNVTS
nr:putative reverse transcriptase domain-containing protein [Tanacetum cinerariifolium]